jgi:L-ascorbate metabolism protein UlaG (beta-lactamase superfamily)
VEGTRIYHAGDTDLIPEMSDMDCDIALLPVSGKYVMNADEAAEAAKRINPKVAIPIHWGSGVVGTIEDAERFQSLLEGTDIDVEIKEKTTP